MCGCLPQAGVHKASSSGPVGHHGSTRLPGPGPLPPPSASPSTSALRSLLDAVGELVMSDSRPGMQHVSRTARMQVDLNLGIQQQGAGPGPGSEYGSGCGLLPPAFSHQQQQQQQRQGMYGGGGREGQLGPELGGKGGGGRGGPLVAILPSLDCVQVGGTLGACHACLGSGYRLRARVCIMRRPLDP